jgi:hypothetical protein
MPIDGLGSDAGRQSLTEVGAGGARGSRAHARPHRSPHVAQRESSADVEPLLTPAKPPLPEKRTVAGLRGERLVALCALGVLAFAAVFFVERLGGLRSVPPPAPPDAPALQAPATVLDTDTAPAVPPPAN